MVYVIECEFHGGFGDSAGRVFRRGVTSAFLYQTLRRRTVTISETLLPEFDQEMAATRRVLERENDGDNLNNMA